MDLSKDYKMAHQYVMCFKETYPDVLEDMKKAHYQYTSTFHPDPYESAARSGERNVVLRILTILDMVEKGEIKNE